jgi:diguanylate cyclase (GGDEF)-like protein
MRAPGGGATPPARLDDGVAGAVLDAARVAELLQGGALEVHYQPVVVLTSRHVVGFEALARMRTPDGLLLPPESFIPVAESSGLIIPLGEAVLRRALVEAACWRKANGLIATATVSVNVAPAQLVQPDFVELVAELLAENELHGSSVNLEITESTVASPQTRPVLERLAAMGVRVALDDFGVGFATLDNLRRLPVHILKLDSSFVSGVTMAGADRAIVRVVIDLADSLGLSVIAEGVETEEQADALIRLGCPAAQGFLFARPNADAAAAAVAARGTHRARGVTEGRVEPWSVEVDTAVLAAVRLLAPEADPHRAGVHAVASGLARLRRTPESFVRAVGRLSLVHDLARLAVDGGLPEVLAGEPRLAALLLVDDAPDEVVATVRAAVRVADAAVLRDAALGRQALARGLRDEANRTPARWPQLAQALRQLAEDPPEIVPLGDLVDDLDRRRLGRRGMEERLRSLVGITRVLASSRDTRELLRVGLEEVRRIVGAASASLERWERESGALRCLVNVGQLGPGEQTLPDDEVYALADYAQARRALLTGLPYVHTVDDADADPDEVELLRSLQKYSSAAVPLYLEGRLWGQLWLTTGLGDPPFASADVEMLTTVTTLMAGVVAQAESLDRMARQAFEDPLTRVGNRRAVDDALDRMSQSGVPASVVLLDVDLLKEINDTLGHAKGDEALIRLADGLSRDLPALPGSSLGRLGGDEFCVVVPECPPEAVRQWIRSVLRQLEANHRGPSVSMGFAAATPPWQPRDLLVAADADLHAAKRRLHAALTRREA